MKGYIVRTTVWAALSAGLLNPGIVEAQAPTVAEAVTAAGGGLRTAIGLRGPVLTRDARLTERINLNKVPLSGGLPLTLQSAIEMALERNPILMVEKVRVEQAREQIEIELGEYDAILSASALAARRDNIVASRFFPEGRYLDTEYAPNVRLEKRNDLGGNLSLGLDYSRLSSTSNTQTLSPQYSANLSVGLAQPLLRDFGRDVTETRLRVAERGADVAESTFSLRISELIQQVEEAYWTYTFLLQDLQAKRRSLEVARGFLQQNEDLFGAGRVAQVSVLQARAAVAEREGDVLTAESDAARFEDRLKNLLWLDLTATDVVPTEQPVRVPVVFDATASFEMALERRPEIQGLQHELEQRELELRFAGNQTRPRLDLAAQYSLAGLSGRPNPTCLDPTSIVCTPVGEGVTETVFANQTSPGDALSTLFRSSPFDTWSVEFSFEMPLGNRAANGRRSEASLRVLEARTQLGTLRDQIEEEVRNAVRETQTAEKRIDTSGETVTYLEDQLDGMEQQLAAGLVSSYDVLQVLDELDQARTRELQALMDYNVGLSRIRLAEASSFERYNIDLAEQPRYEFEPGPEIR